MDITKRKAFNDRMGRRTKLAYGGRVKRKNYDAGGTVAGDFSGALSGAASGAAVGSVIPGIGTAVGAVVGGIGGLLSGLFSGNGGPQMPNITDPVTGQQITDAQGNVVASQQQLQNFATNLQGANGVQNQQAVLGQLQNVANGTGPNPAQAQLAQATGQNVATTTAEMAGQRGASSNTGLIAREAAQQGAATQENAVGQAATLQANQSLNALNSEGAIAGQQVGETQTALTGANTAASTNQGQLLGAQGTYNTNITGGQANVNSSNQQQQQTNLSTAQDVTNAAGTAITALNKGPSTLTNGQPTASSTSGPIANAGNTGSETVTAAHGGLIHKPVDGPHKSHLANYLAMADGGKVPAIVSPGEISLNPEQVRRVLNGENPLKIGEKIKGKAKVKGDSRKNDVVPKTLDEGGVIIPRSHVKDPERAELFVRRAVHMKRNK